MANMTDKDKGKGSQRETAIQGNKPEGVTFKDLISFATGSEAPTEQEFESAMAARGYRSKDVRKLKKAFRMVNDSGKDYFLRDKGFDVYQEGQRESGSGRAKGNKMGTDLGDAVNLGGNVSLLAGALRNEKKGFDQAQTAKQKAMEPDYSNERLGQEAPQSVSPEMEFSRQMRDLLAMTAAGSGKGEPGRESSGKKRPGQGKNPVGAQEKPAGFEIDEDLLNWSPFDSLSPALRDMMGKDASPSSQTSEEQPASQRKDERTKAQIGQDLLMGNREGFGEKGFFDLDAEEFGLESFGLGEAAVDAATTGQVLAPWLAPFKKVQPVGQAINKVAAPFGLAGVAMKGLGDAINPNEDVDWLGLGQDAANIGAMFLLNKMIYKNVPGQAPSSLPGGSKVPRPRTKFSAGKKADEFAGKFAERMNKLQWPQVQTQPAGLLTGRKIGTTGTPANSLSRDLIDENFLMNLTDDLNMLPMKRRGGVITKFRAY